MGDDRRPARVRQDPARPPRGRPGREHLGQRPRHPAPRGRPLGLPRRAPRPDHAGGLGSGCPVPCRRRHRQPARGRRARPRPHAPGPDLPARGVVHHRRPAGRHLGGDGGAAGRARRPGQSLHRAPSARAAVRTGRRPLPPPGGGGRRAPRRPRHPRRGGTPPAPRHRRPAAPHRTARRADRPGRGHQRRADGLPLGGRPRLLRAPRRGPAALLPAAGPHDVPRLPRGPRGDHRRRARRGHHARGRTRAPQPRRGDARRTVRHADPHPPARHLPHRLDRRPRGDPACPAALGRPGGARRAQLRCCRRDVAGRPPGHAEHRRDRLRRRRHPAAGLCDRQPHLLLALHLDEGARRGRDPRGSPRQRRRPRRDRGPGRPTGRDRGLRGPRHLRGHVAARARRRARPQRPRPRRGALQERLDPGRDAPRRGSPGAGAGRGRAGPRARGGGRRDPAPGPEDPGRRARVAGRLPVGDGGRGRDPDRPRLPRGTLDGPVGTHPDGPRGPRAGATDRGRVRRSCRRARRPGGRGGPGRAAGRGPAATPRPVVRADPGGPRRPAVGGAHPGARPGRPRPAPRRRRAAGRRPRRRRRGAGRQRRTGPRRRRGAAAPRPGPARRG